MKRGNAPLDIDSLTDAESAPSRETVPLPQTVSRDELLVGGKDALFRKLVHDFFAFTARHEAVRDGHARRIGLAGMDYTILISIARLSREGDVNVKTVAEHLHVSIGFITNTTRKLRQMGLVEKTPDAKDKRRIILTVTEAGRDRLRTLAPWQRQVNDVEFGGLTHEEFLTLSRIVERLVETSEEAVALQRELERDGAQGGA